MSSIVIQVEGGLVQDVFQMGRGKIKKCYVVDFDDEDYDADKITETKDKSGACLGAYVTEFNLYHLAKDSDVRLMMKEYMRRHHVRI
jgi:hypothetical protein